MMRVGRRVTRLLLSALAGANLAASAAAPRGDAGAWAHIAVDASGDAAALAAAGRRPLMRKAGQGRDAAAPAGADDQLQGAGSVAVGSLATDVAQASRCGYERMATNVSVVSSKGSHACTIHRSNQTLCCWGGAGKGETEVPRDLGRVEGVAAGDSYTCAIRQSDRTVRCWGIRLIGRVRMSLIGRVPRDLGRVEAIAAGTSHTCAIRQSDRTVLCWGSSRMVPRDLGRVEAVAAGAYHTCAIRQSDLAVRCWCSRQTCMIGRVPRDLGRVEAIAVGTSHTCAIRQSDRTVRCWGNSLLGRVPRDLGRVEAVAAGAHHTCAIRQSDLTVRCWGISLNGKVEAEVPRDLGRAEAIAAGGLHTCAIRQSGHVVRCWGGGAVPIVLSLEKQKHEVGIEQQAAEKEKTAAVKARLVAQHDKEQAEEARKKAQQKKIQAEKQEREAKKEREEARRGKAVAVIEKNCSAELTRQVRVEISCAGASDNVSFSALVPDGVMAFGTPVQAHRCTNRAACIATGDQGRRWEGSEIIGATACPLGTRSPNESSPMCSRGYDDQSPGCSRCSEGYGRASMDTFVCQACGVAVLQMAGYIMVPLAIYIISVRGALALSHTRSGIFNDLLKIFLSFGQGAAGVMSAVMTSDSYQALPELSQKFLSSGDSPVGGAALYSGSLDCLTNSTVGIAKFLLLVLLPPAAIVLASLVLIAVQSCLRASHRPAKFYIVLVFLVAGNQFLAQIIGAAFRTLPCAHTQKLEGGEARQFLTYETSTDCQDRPVYYLLLTIGTCALSLVCGPLLWSRVLQGEGEKGWEIMRDSAGEDEEEEAPGGQGQGHHDGDGAAGFLIGNYRDGCRAWEALVLLRKIALSIASTMAPMSYSPGLHIILVLGILMLSLAAHLYAKPFRREKDMLNKVEGASLTVLNVALLLAMYITTDTWSATTTSKQAATMLAGTLLIIWFWVLVALMIQAKLAEVRERSPYEKPVAEGSTGSQQEAGRALHPEHATQGGETAAAATPAAQDEDEGGTSMDEPDRQFSQGRSAADDSVAC